jgi:hypothetical protein
VKTNNSISSASQIRNLLIIFTSGIGLAVLLSLLSLYYYNPSGSYQVKNVLLSPNSLESMRFVDGSSKAGGNPRFVFDTIEFSFYDDGLRKWEKKAVSRDQYSTLYSMINNEKSLDVIPVEVENAFQKAHPATLALKVRIEGAAGIQVPATIFTQVEFAAIGDHYRIQLRDQTNNLGGWAYFHQPGIYKKVLKTLNP